jgi:hypothetical protein
MRVSFIVVAKSLNSNVIEHLKNLRCLTSSSARMSEIILIFNLLDNDQCQQEALSLVDHLDRDQGLGIYAAMNMGLSFATGEYVNFSNPGDTPLEFPHLLGSADMHCFPVRVIDMAGDFKYVRFPNMHGRRMPPHQGMFTRKELHKKFDLRYRYAADLDFFVNFEGSIMFHEQPVVAEFQLGGVSSRRTTFIRRRIDRALIIWRCVLRRFI